MTTRPSSPPSHDHPTGPAEARGDVPDEPFADDLAAGQAITFTFTLPAEIDAQHVSVVGDFNSWDPGRGVMAPNDHGGFSCAVNVVPGQRYRYRFLLDGDRWINDVAAHDYVPNEFGGEDSVLDLSAQADHELAAARERQTADTVEPLGGERPDDGLAPLVNNTGDDGGAATG